MTLPNRKKPAKPLGPFGLQVQKQLESCDLSRTTSERVAEGLNISTTTLRRRLRAEGVSYQEILDGVRMGRLEAFMRRRGYRAYGTSIYIDLGYYEVNSLYRAFRRWYGCHYESARMGLEVAA